MRACAVAGLLGAITVIGLGCSLDFSSPEPRPSRFSPRVIDSSPATDPELPRDGSIEFRVEGHDEDSLELTWAFLLNDSIVEVGETDDGEFLAVYLLQWTNDLSGTTAEVAFEVVDQTAATDLVWTVIVD